MLGTNPIFNTAGGVFIPLSENEIFITGVFGLDPGQLVDDLRRWTDPANELPDLIAGESIAVAHVVLIDLTSALIEEYSKHPEIGKVSPAPIAEVAALQSIKSLVSA